MLKKIHISKVSALHYFKLVYRSLLFLWAFFTYISDQTLHFVSFSHAQTRYIILLMVVWVIFMIEMGLRFFPSDLESKGCQKQFKAAYISTGKDISTAKLNSFKSTFIVALSWILLNGAIAVIYYLGFIDDGILVLISLFFSVSDMICILFYCPFQTLMMKNRCCGTCRIYNWDYLMMFTPLILAKSYFTWSLVIVALALLVRWEITVQRHPERFIEEYNAALKCANCTEKLCSHKKQLHSFWNSQREIMGRLEEQLHEKLPQHLQQHLPDNFSEHIFRIRNYYKSKKG